MMNVVLFVLSSSSDTARSSVWAHREIEVSDARMCTRRWEESMEKPGHM